MRIPVVLFLLFLSLPARAASDVVNWRTLDTETSMSLRYGTAPPVPVLSFRAETVFEPDHAASGKITLHADLTGAFLTPDAYASAAMRQNLDVAQSLGFSQVEGPGAAVLTSTAFLKKGKGRFVMQGTLDLNGRTKTVEVPLTAVIVPYFDLPKLVIKGSFSFQPGDFSTDVLTAPQNAAPVTVDFTLAGVPENAP